jgi:glycosyltransferase involved in cell wall biosynthesis
VRDFRVALFIPSLVGGGAERVTVNLAAGLAAEGMPTDLVVARGTGPLRERVPANVRLVDLRARRLAFATVTLGRYLRETRPAVLVSAISQSNVVALCAAHLAGGRTRTVAATHVAMSEEWSRASGWRDRTALPWLARRWYPRADALVAVSRGAAEDLVRFLGLAKASVRVMPNAVLPADLTALAAEPVADPWFEAGQPPVVLAVARLAPVKDLQTLIRAFADAQSRRVMRLVILGEGEERLELERLVRDLGLEAQVRLPGFVANPYRYMARARVVALSSLSEALPTVLVEALALGARVVSTDCPAGPHEILEGGRWGALVPVGDVSAMGTALADAIGDEARARPPGATLEQYSVSHVAGEYLRLFESLVTDGRDH